MRNPDAKIKDIKIEDIKFDQEEYSRRCAKDKAVNGYLKEISDWEKRRISRQKKHKIKLAGLRSERDSLSRVYSKKKSALDGKIRTQVHLLKPRLSLRQRLQKKLAHRKRAIYILLAAQTQRAYARKIMGQLLKKNES